MPACWKVWSVLLGLLAGGAVARAQDASVGAALRSMASAASDVFVGQVVSVTRKGGVVEVGFRVDSTITGPSAGTYTLREWAGLWPPGMQRYRLGQRVMVFAHAPSAAGLSTPVNGAEGVVPVVPVLSGAALLDVSRLETRVVRSATAALGDEDSGAIALADAMTLVRHCHEPRWEEPLRFRLPLRRPLLPHGQPVPVERGGGEVRMPLLKGVSDAR